MAKNVSAHATMVEGHSSRILVHCRPSIVVLSSGLRADQTRSRGTLAAGVFAWVSHWVWVPW